MRAFFAQRSEIGGPIASLHVGAVILGVGTGELIHSVLGPRVRTVDVLGWPAWMIAVSVGVVAVAAGSEARRGVRVAWILTGAYILAREGLPTAVRGRASAILLSIVVLSQGTLFAWAGWARAGRVPRVTAVSMAFLFASLRLWMFFYSWEYASSSQ